LAASNVKKYASLKCFLVFRLSQWERRIALLGLTGATMATNTRLLGDELQQFTINTLYNLAKEVEEQFGKWSKEKIGFLSQLCAAASYRRAV